MGSGFLLLGVAKQALYMGLYSPQHYGEFNGHFRPNTPDYDVLAAFTLSVFVNM